MEAALIIAIVVTALAAIALLVWESRRRSAARVEDSRHRAAETRDLAGAAQMDADRHAAEAAERSARAERERLAAEQQQLEAEHHRQEAATLHQHADELDPDVDLDAETEAEPLTEVDLREHHGADETLDVDREGRRSAH